MLKTVAMILTGGLIGPSVKNKILPAKQVKFTCHCGRSEQISGMELRQICSKCAKKRRK